LVGKSLVVREEGEGGTRYRLLETIREYGIEHLHQAGEWEAMRARHRAFYLALAERAEAELAGPEQRQRLERLEAEHDNFRLALEVEEGDAPQVANALRLAGALGR